MKSKMNLPVAKAMKASFEGIIYGLPESTYRIAPGMNQSALKPLAKSPAHFQAALAAPDKDTEAKLFGRIGHHLLLTPKLPAFWVVRPPGLDLRKPEGKAWKESLKGKPWVDAETILRVAGAVEALQTHPMVAAALKEGKREVAWFRHYKTKAGKMRLKGRVDLATPGAALCDVKFVEDATERGFQKLIMEHGYHIQGAYYLDGFNQAMQPTYGNQLKTEFVFFVVEKYPPFAVNIFRLGPKARSVGAHTYHTLLTTFLECTKAKSWSVYTDNGPYHPTVRTIELPKWAAPNDGEFVIQ